MKNYLYKEMIIYLFNEVGLDEKSIELGIKLSIRNKTEITLLNNDNVNDSIIKAQNAAIEIVQQRGVATIGNLENKINFL